MKLKSFENFLNERVSVNTVDCDNCDWSWNLQDGGEDLYVCHECGHDNDPSLKESKKKGTTLFSPGDKDAVKGTGYGSKEKALDTVKIIDKLKKKDHMHAMAIATTMMNRAKHSDNQSQGMRDAVPIFKKWIEDNRKA